VVHSLLAWLCGQSPLTHPTCGVQDVSNTGDTVYKDKWVAEVELVRPNAAALRMYLNLIDRVRALRAARARYQRFHFTTPVKDRRGRTIQNPKKCRRMERRVQKLQKHMDAVKNKLATDVTFSEQVENLCIGAFITFEHRESKRRCLADYNVGHMWWGTGTCCLPYALFFRGR